ncbi:MAG TPA: hypothetical protein VN742_01080 [Candidatus Binataceae bacterium]|nr:hypothetical protein [Candidatus Binataceae bacterium]
MNLPRIFGDNQAFIEPSAEILASLDEPTRARLDGVRQASDNLKKAQAAEQAAVDDIADAERTIADATAYSKKHFPPQTPHDLWLENFGSKEDRERRAAMRKAGIK